MQEILLGTAILGGLQFYLPTSVLQLMTFCEEILAAGRCVIKTDYS
jgi:uncharacterized membrane protein YraQ (UPF0718 family)